MDGSAKAIVFEEKQRGDMRRYWLWQAAFGLLILFAWKLREPYPLVLAGFLGGRPYRYLVTQLDGDSLRVKSPFATQYSVPLDKIVRCEVVQYEVSGFWRTVSAPSLQFPSVDIRVSGRRGVRIDQTDGLHALIGSQEPERLAAAILSRKAASIGAEVALE